MILESDFGGEKVYRLTAQEYLGCLGLNEWYYRDADFHRVVREGIANDTGTNLILAEALRSALESKHKLLAELVRVRTDVQTWCAQEKAAIKNQKQAEKYLLRYSILVGLLAGALALGVMAFVKVFII